jgi:hypothetical protein
MKLRVTGTEAECDAAVEALFVGFDVDEVSRFYPNRNGAGLGRVYIDAEPYTGSDVACPSDRSPARVWVVGEPRAVQAVGTVAQSLMDVPILQVGGLADGRLRLDMHVEWSSRPALVHQLRTWLALLDTDTDTEDGPSAGVAAPPTEVPSMSGDKANGATS